MGGQSYARFPFSNLKFVKDNNPHAEVGFETCHTVHQGYIDGETSDENIGKNREIVLIQTSVIDKERASEQWGKTRMTL